MKEMKKIGLVLLAIWGLNTISKAQDDKNFRFGLKGDLSFDWLTPDNQKKFENDGVKVGYDWGLQLEFKLSDIISVVTGASLKYSAGALSYSTGSSADSTYYILNKDQEFVDFDTAAFSVASNTLYRLKSRSYKISYLNIPIALKMKTKEIGYFTYFGEFGANVGIRTRARVNDESELINGSAVSLNKLDLDKGVGFMRAGLLIGGGAEYNLSGSTSLFGALHYNHYFTNTLKPASGEDYLRRFNSETNEYEAVAAKTFAKSVSVTVGILF